MKTVAMMNAVSNMDHSKPTWKVSWLRRWRLLLVTFCLLDLSNGIMFRRSPNKASYRQRSDLDLVCSDKLYPKIVIISKKGGEILLNKTSPTKQWGFEATHRINNIQCDQMGTYECEVLHYDGTKTSNTLDVLVEHCVQLRVSQEGRDIKPGDDVSMTCIGVGYPKSLTISKRGEQGVVTSTKPQQKYTFEVSQQINNIQCDQMGDYECRGLFHGDKSHESLLNVGNSSYSSTTLRKTTTVTPTTTVLKPECPQMDLSKCPGGWFPMRDKTCMKVEKAEKKYYDARTSCRNYGGSLLDRNIDDVTKACILAQLWNGTNHVWLSSWYYLDVQTKESKYYPYIRLGYYACSIQNYVPLSIPFFNLTVFLKGSKGQRVHDINTKVHQFRQFYENVEKGNEFRFECEARGTPVPDLSVYKDGEEVSLTPQRQIINTKAVAITYNTKADRCGELGTFSCNASNVFGNLSSFGNVQIKVPCPTKIIKFKTPRPLVRPGQKAEIKCITESYHWPDITLYRNDTGEVLAYINTFDKSQQLVYTIEKVKCSDMGLYECVAKGSGNPQRKISQLTVYHCPPQLCPGEDEKKTISVAVGETKTVSICVISYPDLRQFLLNETRIYSSRKDPKFDVHYNRTDRSSLYYTIYVTIKNITQGDYGTLSIEMWTSYSQKAEYQLQIQPEENPIQDEIVEAVEEEIPVDVSESPVDYVGEKLDLWETTPTESKCRKIEELMMLTPIRHMRMGVLWTKFIKVLFIVHCILDKNVNI